MSADARLEAVLSHALAERTPTRTERVEDGNRKRTYRVAFRTGPTLAVQYAPDDANRLVTEGALVRDLDSRSRSGIGSSGSGSGIGSSGSSSNTTAVPVPRVVASGVRNGRSYLLTEWVEGSSLHGAFTRFDRSDQVAIARALGCYLAAVHEYRVFPSFGSLASDGGELVVEVQMDDWRAAFRALVDEGLGEFCGPLAALVPEIEAALDAGIDSIPRAPTPRLFPWDYRPGNVLVHEGRIAAILDWESPRTAHREFSLAKAEYLLCDWYDTGDGNDVSGENDGTGGDGKIDSATIRAAFYAGYSARFPIPEGYWHERRRLYRLGAITRAAFDSRGLVTRPGYPMVDPDSAIAFHRGNVEELL